MEEVGFTSNLRDNSSMSSRLIEISGVRATLRGLTLSDELAVVALGKSGAWFGSFWSGDQFRAQLRSFPDGQIGVEVDGRLVASSAAHIVHFGQAAYRAHTRAGITEDGYFHNHDAQGDTLYLSQVIVSAEWQRKELAAELLTAQLDSCRRLNLRRVLVALPPARTGEGATRERAEEQSESAVYDPDRVVFTKHGFSARAALPDYCTAADAVLLEWLNPDYEAPLTGSSWVRLALVQHQVRGVKDFDEFASQVEYFVKAARGYGADFVMFPEFTSLQLLSSAALRNQSATVAIEKLSHLTSDVFGLFSRLARLHRLHIIGGSHPVPFMDHGQSALQNVCPVALPDGRVLMQPKLHITPSETEAWGLRGGAHLAVIPTPKAKIGVLICYDSEFPEAARHLADQGIDILFVPYCTDDRQGHLRVQLCCRARAIENQIYVAAAGLVGNLPGVAGLDVHYGQAAVFTPSDFTFARDGIQAQATPNVETLLVTDLDLGNLHRARERGSVRPRLDRRPDLFETRTHLAGSELPEYPLGEPTDRA